MDAPGLLHGRADEEIGVPVAVLIARQRQVPTEVPGLRLLVPPEFLAGFGRARHDDAPHLPVHRGVGGRDDEVGEPVARDVRHGEHPVAEEALAPLAVPGADERAGRPRPDRGAPVLVDLLLDLEAGPGGDVGVPVTVDVEWLAEAEAELTGRDAPGKPPRHTPAGPRSGAERRGRCGRRETREDESGGGDREAASPARACRRRRVLHRQQPTQRKLALHCKLIWTGPRAPVLMLTSTASPREVVCAVPYSHV